MVRDRLRIVLYSAVILFFAVPVMVVLAILTFLLQKSAEAVELVGRYFSTEDTIEKTFRKRLDEEMMLQFRDDMMELIIGSMEFDDDLDRWGLLREMDKGRDELEEQLRDGELAFSLTGGSLSILIALLGRVPLAGVLLTGITIISAILVVLRITAVSILSFDSSKYRQAPYRTLVYASIWNRVVMTGNAPLGISVIAILAQQTNKGYDAGLWVIERITYGRADPSDLKWRIEES